ncbi:MAG: hypothetical protein J7M19_09100 [Planctomycetes bacterium]|nr:hypothetical protein [Planctomycetota bacterium]
MSRGTKSSPADSNPGACPRQEDKRPAWRDLLHLGGAHRLLRPRFDRVLILGVFLAFLSLYLPWLPGLYSAVPGWKVPYCAPSVSLDVIRHLEAVKRPESLFLLSLVGVIALVFSRTSRYAGVRDFVAAIILAAGGGYALIYFADEWGWCLLYNYVGPYAAFTALALVVLAGVRRTTFVPWVPVSRALLLLASAFLITGWFMPWSLDHSGVMLLLASKQFYWLGSLKIYTVLMPIFPLLGVAAFLSAFIDLPALPAFVRRGWPLSFGLATLIYFRAVWAAYLVGFPLGSWGTLTGLTLLTAAGIFHVLPRRPFLAKALLLVFVAADAAVWISFLSGGRLLALTGEFLSVPGPFGL